MIKLLALLMFLVASCDYLFKWHEGRFGAGAFVTFGLTLWCLSSEWDHSYRRRSSPEA